MDTAEVSEVTLNAVETDDEDDIDDSREEPWMPPYTMEGSLRASSRDIRSARSLRLEKGMKGGASGAIIWMGVA